jgi:hypothetical protein
VIKKIKHILAAAMLMGAVATPIALPAVVHAQAGNEVIEQGLCGGSNLTFTSGNCDDNDATNRLNNIIKTIINVVSIVVGVVAVIMIVFGGLKYITSGGESSNVSSAKNTIIYAIIGLVVVALAQFIVRFVLDRSINGTTT